MNPTHWSRRQFFGLAAGGSIAAGSLPNLLAQDPERQPDGRPRVTKSRSTSGDKVIEPDWNERLSLTVGQKEGDLVGTTSKVLQAAIDYVAQLGGGTVRIQPGTYLLRSSLHLRSHVRLLGAGEDTILTKPASVTTKLAEDSDWYDQEITLNDAKGFEVGDSVCLRTRNPHNGSPAVLKRTLVARSGNRFKLDRPLRDNFWIIGESTCSTLFPLVTGEEVENLVIENLTLDGNRGNNEHLDGNYGGCLFLQDVNQVQIRKVTARNNNGDGFSWQICHDVTVEDCHSHDNADLGMHPGSGSQRPLMRRNKIERCQIGIFFCWGVKFGLAEENTILDIRGQGISIGHRDTDNIVRKNLVRSSGQTGILFRPERGASFCGHRNLIEQNIVENTGPADGIAIDVQGGTEQVTLRENQILETRAAAQRIGIKLGKETKEIKLVDNHFSGFSQNVVQG
ncbi:right-handed parallel beta-helix repeat-containing protein [Schlesneria sp. T3-172]|uniref:right-handed parallel beta-helix repeat-containing protein n=1 Tax=Schlesneria sphaerica TaxID=3373610 RepID=UPI0037C74D8C